jgi:hypothetical protein
MNSYVNQLVDEQHAAIDAMQPECIRERHERGVIDVGTDGCYKVWYAIGTKGTTKKADQYSEAIRLMERALADGAGVVTIEHTYGFIWAQEVWALVGEVQS